MERLNNFAPQKIAPQIIKNSKFSAQETVILSNSERDLTMVNQNRYGIFIGRPATASSQEISLDKNIIFLSDINFEELGTRIDRFTESIKQARKEGKEGV
jgi:hypothetical protein